MYVYICMYYMYNNKYYIYTICIYLTYIYVYTIRQIYRQIQLMASKRCHLNAHLRSDIIAYSNLQIDQLCLVNYLHTMSEYLISFFPPFQCAKYSSLFHKRQLLQDISLLWVKSDCYQLTYCDNKTCVYNTVLILLGFRSLYCSPGR